MHPTAHRRSSTFNATAPASLRGFTGDLFSDSRRHGYQGPIRNVRLPRAATSGGGTIANSEDGVRCVVAGRESLRILRLSDPDETPTNEHKSSVGRGGHRIDSSRNLWDGSGLKIDSASTDVAWCSGNYNNKILTSARNGDLIMWDLNKSGSTKYERKTKYHNRSIHKLSCSTIVPYYCVTGSADGDMRIWDLRDMSRSIMKIHHPTSVRSLVFSPCLSHPLQAVVGLDNGSIYRWDLQMGQRGQLDRLPVAHSGAILALDWCSTTAGSGMGDELGGAMDRSWIVSGGLDHTVKVWDLSSSGSSSHIAHKPTYTLHPSYPVRRVIWRPDYPCELALVSNADWGGGSGSDLVTSPRLQNAGTAFISSTSTGGDAKDAEVKSSTSGEAVEIWDVRRGWIAKWTVEASAAEGGVTDATFRDSHAFWAQHVSGTFAQVDLRTSARPIDAIPRVALSWNVSSSSDGALAFVVDKKGRWEVPYDDVDPLLFERNMKPKVPGDKSRVPGLQNMGTYVRAPQSGDLPNELFGRLAKGYIVPENPEQRKQACLINAEASVALQAGDIHAAQVWFLLTSLLTDIVPGSISSSLPPVGKITQPFPLFHSISAPAALPTINSIGPRSSVSTNPSQTQRRSTSHNSNSTSASNNDRQHRHRSETQPPPPTKPPPNSRNLTPASSASSSPRHVPVSLPPTPALPPTTIMTPATPTPRRPSVLVSTSALVHSNGRRPSVYSRASAVPSAHSESPGAASASDKSLRHVGEGALDDSDSSDGDGSNVGESQGELEPLEAAVARLPMRQARSLSLGRAGPAHPSPLSRLAGQQRWTEDEDEGPKGISSDDEASPSPGSTDTDGERSECESDEEGTRRTVRVKASSARSRSRKNSVAKRKKSRSRSSTVVSLAAPLRSPSVSPPSSTPVSPEQSKAVAKHESQSSVQTVIAGSILEQHNEAPARPEDQEDAIDKACESWKDMSDRMKISVIEQEYQLREACWQAMRDALEEFADEGDIQMCAMLSLIAPEELKIKTTRAIRFIEAYIDILMRHQLHTAAAYLRKRTEIEDVRRTTMLETVIYTACGRCRKAVVVVRSRTSATKASHAICTSCKAAVVRCSICHLPVRNLLFQCSVCAHGGHQDCYRRYYMKRPMLELASQPYAARGRQLHRDQDDVNDTVDKVKMMERSMAGHPCAAGCGHFCWAAVAHSEPSG
ncbi:hypothetical protein F5I97DRAFT_1810259 [Phlebopus sp. FC_14]|nr:hypothetical protein F5I97DRAFT_1810259 [Phlebopus sp. FC_14]